MAQFQFFIIGDEILSGRRQDQHFTQGLQALQRHGHQLAGARYLPDDPAVIEAAFAATLASGANVISFGGIGATPDDHTRAALARAAGVALSPQPEAVALIEARFGSDAYPHRIRMAEFPAGSSLIPNPVNQVAGAWFRQHALLPGFPSMAWPMLEWVLSTHFSDGELATVCSVVVPDAREGDLITLMEEWVQRYPALGFSSLPSFGNARHPSPHIEFSFSGPAEQAEAALASWCEALDARGLAWFRPAPAQ
ncbi:competence/damage-inducible protein A [Chitinibacter tainanensis]|uniref:competence/damage-inducible protein A n=1 Tax=Chitinibacter tainanensis TaxID=230667 RepID=UPI0003F77E33|nr:molybdopterin-binding protein [Chitinibacter tainanensis]